MALKTLYILKVGSTFPPLAAEFGDFDAWTCAGLGALALPIAVVCPELGDDLPQPAQCAGVVITGSHAMVTENLPWSLTIENWIPSLLAAGIPLLGICYGHQLLARAAGGEVGYHPQGQEVGTVEVELLPAALQDPLFHNFPHRFRAHATHAQTVLRLPPGATLLARNSFEPHHAFALGAGAWGVQFHPEYTAAIMRGYIQAQAHSLESAGQDLTALLAGVTATPAAATTLKNFATLVASRMHPLRSGLLKNRRVIHRI